MKLILEPWYLLSSGLQRQEGFPDGKSKQKTIIEDGAFIGSNSSLIAPIKIEKNAYIGSGSAISKNVKANSLAIERSKQMEVKNWSTKVKK